MKKLDFYIIKKFLGTFIFSIVLIISIVIVFDISEKLEDFIEKSAPLKAIIVDYYLNFIPYFVNLFSPLFIFISVIFFTSKLAGNSEIISMLASGISFNRLLRPYIITATILAILSFYLGNFLIPDANKKRLVFEEQYYRNKFRNNDQNIHLKIGEQTYIYMSSFNVDLNMGHNFAIEQFNDGKLVYKLLSDNIRWDSLNNNWTINNYTERYINRLDEKINTGLKKDTILNFHPSEFKRRDNFVETMNIYELNNFIEQEEFKGSKNVVFYKLEKHKRTAFPFATFILTIIGVAIASRKVRGGIGLHIGLGIFISFSFILFMQVSSTLATNSGFPVILAVWIPNILYSVLAFYLYTKAQK